MCPIDQVKIFYGQAITSHPEIYHSYTFDQWLSYLTNNDLIEITGDQVRLTPDGTAFIPFIASRGYSLSRPA
jgi:hypothetical protein